MKRWAMFIVLFLSMLAAIAAEAQSPANPPFPDQIQEMREQIQSLQEKVETLESYLQAIGRFSIPKEVEFCGQKVPIDRWYVREELDKQLLALSYNRRQVVTWMKRSGKFFPYVEAELKKSGMPDCIKYLMVVESSLLEDAYSRAGASGPWQFMKSTGRLFDLSYSKFIDERRDFEKATTAALKYLKELHNEFGDWPLAFAGYNAGENKVRQIMQGQQVREYWRMLFLNKNGIPTETNSYVYKIIAVKLIFADPKSFGFLVGEDDLFLAPETKEITIKLNQTTSLLERARRYQTSFFELKKLNPWIRGDKLGKGAWRLKIPVN